MVLFKTKKLKKETAKKKRYLKHYKKAGPKHAMSYAQWTKTGEKPVYFKNIKRSSVESRLREAGLSEADVNKFRKKK